VACKRKGTSVVISAILLIFIAVGTSLVLYQVFNSSQVNAGGDPYDVLENLKVVDVSNDSSIVFLSVLNRGSVDAVVTTVYLSSPLSSYFRVFTPDITTIPVGAIVTIPIPASLVDFTIPIDFKVATTRGTLSESLFMIFRGGSFVETQFYNLTISAATINGADCGTTVPAPGIRAYEMGSIVPVAAQAFDGYEFDHWVLDGSSAGSSTTCTVTMNSDHTLVAVFKPVTVTHYSLSVSVIGGGTTNLTGVHAYPSGTNVTVTATKNEGYAFDHWVLDGSSAGSSTSIPVTMNSDHTLVAVFVAEPNEGNYQIKGVKFSDANQNGAYDTGELRLSNWNITLKNSSGNVIAWTLTDENGAYVFNITNAGTYYVSEVMQSGWTNTTAIEKAVTVGSATHITALPDPIEVLTIASGRIGDRSTSSSGTRELYLGSAYAQYRWSSGISVPFTLSYDGTTLTYTVGSGSSNRTLSQTFSGSFSDIIIFANSTSLSTMSITNLKLNGASVGSSISITGGSDYLRIAGLASGGFTLTGTLRMSWTGTAPTGSALGYQIMLCDTFTSYNFSNYHVSSASNYSLNVQATDGGTTSPAPGIYSYVNGTVVTMAATNDLGYAFDHWVLDGSSAGSSTSIPVTMNSDHTLVAVFKPAITYYALNVSVVGSGTTNNTGIHSYASGTSVTVTETPDDGYEFDHWVLDGSSAGSSTSIPVTMNSDHTLVAVFKPLPYYTLTIQTTNGGTTNPSPGNISYVKGTNVTVSALPSSGYMFDHWVLDGSSAGSSATCTVTMNSDHTITATFGNYIVREYNPTIYRNVRWSSSYSLKASVYSGDMNNTNVIQEVDNYKVSISSDYGCAQGVSGQFIVKGIQTSNIANLTVTIVENVDWGSNSGSTRLDIKWSLCKYSAANNAISNTFLKSTPVYTIYKSSDNGATRVHTLVLTDPTDIANFIGNDGTAVVQLLYDGMTSGMSTFYVLVDQIQLDITYYTPP